jgi:hypothetical protein
LPELTTEEQSLVFRHGRIASSHRLGTGAFATAFKRFLQLINILLQFLDPLLQFLLTGVLGLIHLLAAAVERAMAIRNTTNFDQLLLDGEGSTLHDLIADPQNTNNLDQLDWDLAAEAIEAALPEDDERTEWFKRNQLQGETLKAMAEASSPMESRPSIGQVRLRE